MQCSPPSRRHGRPLRAVSSPSPCRLLAGANSEKTATATSAAGVAAAAVITTSAGIKHGARRLLMEMDMDGERWSNVRAIFLMLTRFL